MAVITKALEQGLLTHPGVALTPREGLHCQERYDPVCVGQVLLSVEGIAAGIRYRQRFIGHPHGTSAVVAL
jgi:hypothetical protein